MGPVRKNTARAKAITFASEMLQKSDISQWAKENTDLSGEEIKVAQAHLEQLGRSLGHSAEQAEQEAIHA